MHDLPHGQRLTTADPDIAEAVATFGQEVISHGRRADVILPAAARAPECALTQACAGALYLFLHTRDGVTKAEPFIAAARAHAAHASDHEQMFTSAISAWCDGDIPYAAEMHGQIARRWPGDILSAKLGQVHDLSLGRAEAMRDTALACVRARPGDGQALGLYAFAAEQVGELDAAARAAEQALELVPDDPWAQHSQAHVLTRAADVDGCLSFMAASAPAWERCSSFMYTHNWWHLALMYLERGDPRAALGIFDDHVWAKRREYVQDQVNGISLLLRTELKGFDVGERWQSVADFAAARTRDHLNGFVDLHTVYALARAGREQELADMRQSLAAHAAACAAAGDTLWRDVAVPAAEALIRHARGESRVAAEALKPLAGVLHRLGGSTVQRQIYDGLLAATARRTAAA